MGYDSNRLCAEPMPDGPHIRARQVQNSLAALAKLAPEREHEIYAKLDAIDPAILAGVRRARARDWIPLAHDVQLSEVVEATLGPGSDRARARASLTLSLESSTFLKPLVHGVELVFGLEPSALLRQTTRGWAALFLNAGSIRYVVAGPSERLIEYTEIPQVVVDSEVYLNSIAGALEALAGLAKVAATVEVRERDTAERRAVFRARW